MSMMFGSALQVIDKIIIMVLFMIIMGTPRLLLAASHDDAIIDDLFSLPLEQLTNMDYVVHTVSKRAEKIMDAPGDVTVMTADDIKRFGAKSLMDVLSRFPNVYMWGSEVLRNNVASIRGGSPTHADTHTLILLNGRPMRDSLSGINLPIYESFPVDAIHHIEMVRGPGSVLYGSNAFTGVINIITKSPKDIPKNKVVVGGGSFATRMASALGALEVNEFNLVGAINGRDSDGWNIPFIDANGVKAGYEHSEKIYSGFMQANYKDITLAAFSGDVTTDRLGAAVRFPATPNRRQRQFFDAGYKVNLPHNWEATVNGTLNNYYQESVGVATNDRLFEIGLSGPLGNEVTLTTGATIDYHYGEMISSTREIYDDVTWYGYYTQIDYPLTEWAKLIGGFQLNKASDYKYDIVPRLGVVMHFTPAWGAKILYGEAFRSSYVGEKTFNFGYLVGSQNLRPETITTVDAQLFYNDGDYSSAVTIYRSMQEEAIIRVNTVPIQFVNSGKIDYSGIAWEWRAKLKMHWDLLGSVSYQAGEDEQGNKDVGFIPHYMGKVGLSYTSGTGYQVGLFNSYYSEAAKIEKISSAAVVNPSAESYHWLTLNASLDLSKLTGSPILLNIYGENLLDHEVFFPEVFTREINTTPMRSGRAAYATVTVKF